ncbi:MAG: phosphoribosylanthranilate isomerase [Verrucomicrobia bacterium]|nr:phosphoribosylanthranilate isomerase [Verrucomicrobiota bacterium]
MTVQVKICGITNLADAQAAVAAGADALGFMFFAGSPRHLGVPAAARIVARLPNHVAAVGVFVNPTTEEVRRAVGECGLEALQFHGEEAPDFIARLQALDLFARPLAAAARAKTFSLPTQPIRTIKAFRIRAAASLSALSAFATDLWLLDSYVPGTRGGTGARFNWDLALEAKGRGRPIMLAGGLTPENVATAVASVAPFAVDVSSGVEVAPGKKEHARVRAFVAAAKGSTTA